MDTQLMPRRLLASDMQNASSNDMGNVIVLLLVFFASAFFFLTIARLLRAFFFHNRAESIDIARRHQYEFLLGGARHGLSPSAIAEIPTLKYRRDIKHGSGIGGGWAQCAICLSFLEEEEMVRQLPECKHLFHVECIDKWLNSHATCPLCRSSVGDQIAGCEIDLEAQPSTSVVGARVEETEVRSVS
ncbi:RING/U-box superfamily protein [Rhynchospora pubera]|uniref:RING-type E3 ubiquitin transferase n=1 Tax=Rhynchospora pubera TaxID=906938 RepID=A0AAV8GZI2_9POAL|nr:RING/U-box superfamily protein [Rhynchospora pubera]